MKTPKPTPPASAPSATPRTDRMIVNFKKSGELSATAFLRDIVYADFARQLEIDLTAAKAALSDERARGDALRAGLEAMAKQQLGDEMEQSAYNSADFESAYETFVEFARETLLQKHNAK